MKIIDYLNKLDHIQETEFITVTELVRYIGISYNTLVRIRLNPDSCSMKTRRKIKKYVDSFEVKNMSVIH